MDVLLPALIGALAGAGVYLLLREFLPSTPDLARALGRLDGTQTLVQVQLDDGASLTSRLGVWVQRHLNSGGLFGIRVPDADLEILGKERHVLLGEKLLASLAALVFVPALAAILGLAGISLPILAPAFVAVLVALAAWFLPDMLLRTQAEEAREDFARSASAYMDLVAIGRISGMMSNEALATAAGVSHNWAFTRIATALNRARWSGDRPWEGIKDLRDELAVPELGDIADIMRLSGEGGAQIYETLRGRAKALRSAQLSHLHAAANRESERMTIPMTLTSVIMLVAIGYPAITAILG